MSICSDIVIYRTITLAFPKWIKTERVKTLCKQTRVDASVSPAMAALVAVATGDPGQGRVTHELHQPFPLPVPDFPVIYSNERHYFIHLQYCYSCPPLHLTSNSHHDDNVHRASSRSTRSNRLARRNSHAALHTLLARWTAC